jgi:penicillin amidase
VRVATQSFGASARLVVSPGREDEGILHIPAGQSGHPWSPHYRDSQPAWLEGRATPLLAGEAEAELLLIPKKPMGD